MTDLVVDTSVVLKWFHHEDEDEVDGARALLSAHGDGRVAARVLDLTYYELGNVLTRRLRWPAGAVVDQLDDLEILCGCGLSLDRAARALAGVLAERHELTFYDAAHAAIAQRHDAGLATADAELVGAGLGERPTALAQRLGLLSI